MIALLERTLSSSLPRVGVAVRAFQGGFQPRAAAALRWPGRVCRNLRTMGLLEGRTDGTLYDLGLRRDDLCDAARLILTADVGAFLETRAARRRLG